MKKSRKKYNKPKMLVERFVPQEYISVCDWAIGDELYTTCTNTKVTVTAISNSLPSSGQVGSSNGTINVDNNTGDLTFGGSISEGHGQSAQNGEYYSFQSAGGHAGDPWNGLTLCNHNVPGYHHHISHYNKKNPS